MSSASSWSHTSTATHWPKTGFNDWTGTATFGPPVTFACDYSAESVRMTDAQGVEFTSRQVIHTERASIVQGDMVLIGTHTGDPITAKAFEVRSVTRYADTFSNEADDYKVAS
ncbi:MAG: hypothetical protein KBG00_07955 [Rhodoferax sp.]|jgi:hypothetical protein|uniref:hypothetical protein n=1 Tax=Rhodoferax sp. TaxID=50421 RepID=UPI001B3EA089|nr:hypothetical protein [Rhodoferax sp.]MBP9148702.1 hypothetical protein [Rhodoferax sp.]MBP9736264.1 hypothetical protein [Rhodoferax sp.]